MQKLLYKDYFDIDPKYYAAVTADLIDQGKVDWKGYYPHESFIKLLETTYNVLSGIATRSIWEEGSYGTGKSHGALTIKCLLEASDEEVKEYFNDYGLSQDFCGKFISMKNSGKIIVIHRIGSAGIDTDLDLILAVQQSIMAALKKHGIQNQADASMRDSFLKWVEAPENKAYFSALIAKEKYSMEFSGMSVDSVIDRLKNGTDDQIELCMRDVMTVLKDAGQYGLFSDVNDMAEWIKQIIEKNQLTAILFIWDEFSEYFLNHPVGLTGFQTLAEISLSNPFYFLIVAHESRNLFVDAETAKKTLGRFEKPVRIELPDNMAFRLMHKAMKNTSDPVLASQWMDKYYPTLNKNLIEARNVITECSKRQSRMGNKTIISDVDLQGIVPIHPYAALVLKHIATVFNSNQRSMFDFIISPDMTDAKGFKWYINNYGPLDLEENLLTVDLLWDFFYGKEQSGLNDDVRGVLNSFNLLHSEKLLPEEQRVLKTILLLQAISLRVTGNELLAPNEENLELAFMGTDWQKFKAINIANGLEQKNILSKKPVGNNRFEYVVGNTSVGENIASHRKKIIDSTTTQGLIVNGSLLDAIKLPARIDKRYVVSPTGYANFTKTVSELIGQVLPNRFKVIITFAIDDNESMQIHQQIIKRMNMPNNDLLFIETLTPMGKDLFDQYIENMAHSSANAGNDKDQARHFQRSAIKILTDWQTKIKNGAFMLYDPSNKSGHRKANLDDLINSLISINRNKYYFGLEQYNLTSTMFSAFNLATGAGCGLNQDTSPSGYSNKDKDLTFEHALEGAWHINKYWEDPAKQSLTIVQIKLKVDEYVRNGFNSGSGRVSISALYSELENEPFGFMPTSATAVILGFVLKEYATSEYFWSNGSLNEVMTHDKMKLMIANALNNRINPKKSYKEEFLVTMTPAVREFLNCTSTAFGISETLCSSVENARDQVRVKMKGFSFPIWAVKSILDKQKLTVPKEVIVKAIDCYTGLANTANASGATETELAERIGDLNAEYPTLSETLKGLFTSSACKDGMLAYIEGFRDGLLPQLASELGDGGMYIDEVKKKFNAEDANWVWNTATADARISEVILDYLIIKESNKHLPKCTSIRECVSAWNMKTNQIRIPCEVVKKSTGDLGAFLEQLYIVKQNNTIIDQNKQTFYDLVSVQGDAFDAFYKNQLPYFIMDANAFLGDLTDTEKDDLFKSLPAGQFTKSKQDFYKMVQAEVEKFIQSQWKKKLHDLWLDKTGTKNPRDWSQRYKTPILCLFDDVNRSNARNIFRIINSSNPSEADAKKAISFLEQADFYDFISDDTNRDQCFMKRIVGSNSVLLKDVNEIRNELLSKSNDSVYDWMDNSSIQNILRMMADKKYKLVGCDMAMSVINNMELEDLRKYVIDRIMDDPEFGMQILKESK